MKVKFKKGNAVRPVFLVALALVFGYFLGNSGLLAQIANKGNVEGTSTGFNEFGYNYGARIFVGPADGVDKILDGKVWGDPTYANDHLVMKWNAEWDRGNSEGWTDPNGYNAWEDNEWNGMVPNGSRTNWHYKIVWDKGCKDSNTPTAKGNAYCIWGQFAVIMDQGIDFNSSPVHTWFAKGIPNGYGAYK